MISTCGRKQPQSTYCDLNVVSLLLRRYEGSMEVAGSQRAISAEEAGDTEFEKVRSGKSIEELLL